MSEVQLHLGDCIEFMRGMPAGSFQLIIADPPYNAINRETNGLRDIDKGDADDTPVDIMEVSSELIRVAKGSIYVWCSDEQYTDWTMAFKNAGLSTRKCAWRKTNPSPMNGEHLWLSGLELCVYARKPGAVFNNHCQVPMWSGPSEKVEGHPTPKPVWLMKTLVLASSHPDDVVFDPYTGAGSTGVACMKTGRNFVGCEIKKQYFSLAKTRIQNTQQQPLLPFMTNDKPIQPVQAELSWL